MPTLKFLVLRIHNTVFTVRNRARELIELLSDVEKIRAERRKAKANRSKYVGVGNDGTGGFDSGARYGGDSFNSPYNGSYGNGQLAFGYQLLSYSQITIQVVAAVALLAEARLSAILATSMKNTTLAMMNLPRHQQGRTHSVLSHLHLLRQWHHSLKLIFWVALVILHRSLALWVVWPETKRSPVWMVRGCSHLSSQNLMFHRR